MKKFFNDAEIELIVFVANDIITTSGDEPFPGDDDNLEYN